MIRRRAEAGSTAGFALSLMFALVLLGIQSVEFWLDSWLPEEGQAAPITLRLPSFSVFRLHLGQPAELVQRQVIIGQGEVLEPNEDMRLAAAYEQIRRRNQVGWSLGMFLVSFMAALLLLGELRQNPGNARYLKAQVILIALVLLFAAGAKAFLLLTSLPSYYFPMPAIPLLIAFLFNRRQALAFNLFTATAYASLLGFDLSAFVVLFTTSYTGALFIRDRKKRRAIVQAGSLSGWFGALALLVLMLVFAGTINVHLELLNPDYSAVLAAIVCGVFSGVIAFLLVEPIGWLIGRVSPSKLIDLQDLDHPILKQIRDKAPGTWEHSRAAANLAEAAAAAIRADSLLVRVGAYVHDAGKALNPAYFIENQTALGITNPHQELEPEVSADCIFDHVREGTDLLRKHHVPEAVVEFAYTHHGTSLLEYFWVKNMQAGNPNALKERAFRYPGMRPRNRETGILMIVDAVEAASRTIKEPAKHKFENLVQRIVYTKLNQGQLDECGLTLADLKAVSTTLVDSLVNMYHARIEYPWQRATTTTSQTGTRSIHDTGAAAITQTGTRAVARTGDHQTEPVESSSRPKASETPTPVSPPVQAKPPRPSQSGEVVPIAAAQRQDSSKTKEPDVSSADPGRRDESSQTALKKSRRKKQVTLSGIAPVQDDADSRPDDESSSSTRGRPATTPALEETPSQESRSSLSPSPTTENLESNPTTAPAEESPLPEARAVGDQTKKGLG